MFQQKLSNQYTAVTLHKPLDNAYYSDLVGLCLRRYCIDVYKVLSGFGTNRNPNHMNLRHTSSHYEHRQDRRNKLERNRSGFGPSVGTGPHRTLAPRHSVDSSHFSTCFASRLHVVLIESSFRRLCSHQLGIATPSLFVLSQHKKKII